MGIGATFGNDLLKLILQAVAVANIADNAAGSPLTTLGLALHTADPSTTGANETTYGGYGRVSIARTSGGWTVSGLQATPGANIDFPVCTSGSATITHWSLWTLTAAGKFLVGGTVSPNISVATGVTPRLTTATTLTVS